MSCFLFQLQHKMSEHITITAKTMVNSDAYINANIPVGMFLTFNSNESIIGRIIVRIICYCMQNVHHIEDLYIANNDAYALCVKEITTLAKTISLHRLIISEHDIIPQISTAFSSWKFMNIFISGEEFIRLLCLESMSLSFGTTELAFNEVQLKDRIEKLESNAQQPLQQMQSPQLIITRNQKIVYDKCGINVTERLQEFAELVAVHTRKRKLTSSDTN